MINFYFTVLILSLSLTAEALYCTGNKPKETHSPTPNKFKLLTTLYNEKNKERCLEFITCVETNLKNRSIDTIHVIYDTSKDDSNGSILLDYLKYKKLKISYISDRASCGNFFRIANKEYPNCRIIISNADIFFDETLSLLEKCDLSNKFLALTRWDVQANGSLKEYAKKGQSADVLIFQTPLPKFEDDTVKIGLLGCEYPIAYQAKKVGLKLFNPSLSVICSHLHLSKIRNYPPGLPYKKMGNITAIPKCKISELYTKIGKT